MPSKEDQPHKRHIDHESSDGDCTCELLDTSLSGVGDSDCSCSECLEANLQAFNQLKQDQQWLEKQNENKLNRGGSTRVTTTNKQTRGVSRNTDQFQSKTQSRLNNYKSLDKYGPNRSQTAINRTQKQTKNMYKQMAEDSAPQFTKQSMNDFIKITQYRAREYLQQRRKLKNGEIQEREKLKKMIKQNLQALKFSAKAIREQQKKEGEQPSYDWNHRPYHCKSRVQCRKLIPYEPNLEEKAEEIRQIKQRIKKYKQQNKKQNYQCPDQCPRHHMRTSQQKINQISKFIKEKAKAYQKERKKQQKQKIKKQKILQAKLRAIDLKCKNIVTKSKKIDPSVSRTSFHNSIDHFSTFSQLKQFKQQKDLQKANKRKINKALNERGGILEDQIYQNLQDCLIGDHPPIHSYIGTQSRHHPRQEETQQWCQKIVKDARLKPPKQIRKDEKAIKDVKFKNQKVKQVQMTSKIGESSKSKGPSEKNIKKQEQRRKQIEMEIERKKQQIYKQYQKRNSNIKDTKESSKNQKLRQTYEQKLKQKKIPLYGKSNKKQQSYDSYRQVYKNQPSSDPKQLEVVGDPLMQQYQYQRNMGRYKQLQIDEDHQIFTKSGTNLKSKPALYV